MRLALLEVSKHFGFTTQIRAKSIRAYPGRKRRNGQFMLRGCLSCCYSGNSILWSPPCCKRRMSQPSDLNLNLIHAKVMTPDKVASSTVTAEKSISECSKTGTSYLNSSGVFRLIFHCGYYSECLCRSTATI